MILQAFDELGGPNFLARLRDQHRAADRGVRAGAAAQAHGGVLASLDRGIDRARRSVGAAATAVRNILHLQPAFDRFCQRTAGLLACFARPTCGFTRSSGIGPSRASV